MKLPRVPDLLASPRIVRNLTSLLYRPQTIDGAKALIRARLAARSVLFLKMVKETIWPYPHNPYRRLLQWSGWSIERLEESVKQRGLEATLRVLMDDGVYLNFEELKHRRPIRRHDLLLEHKEGDFDNPTVLPSHEVRTGGTHSEASRVPGSLEYLTHQRAPARLLMLEALGVSTQPVVLWVTQDASVNWWLALAHGGRPPVRWFSLTDLSAFRVPQAHTMMFTIARFIGFTRGLRLPRLEHIPLSGVDTVLKAVLTVRARHGVCVVITTASAAARLAALASTTGRDLAGVTISVGSEPLTPGKHAEIVRAGARVSGRYSMTELGMIGCPCGRPAALDDVHFMADSFGLVRDQRTLPDGESVEALFMTTLLPSSPVIFINVETDDIARVTQRECGCLWQELGLTTHFDTIRSLSKFKGEGSMVLGSDCLRILEEVLPREFGGRSIDYQLLEAEDENHLTRLYLVVSPAVGTIDEDRLRTRFIEELRDPTRVQALVPQLWRQANTITVLRREPVATPRGKLLPFHTLRLASRDWDAP